MAITYSTLRKPDNPQVIDPLSGQMREEWQLYFGQLTTRVNAAVGDLEVDDAPADAEYLVGAAASGLSAERLVTNSTTNTWNLATPGQAAVERAALTGDVTASANSNATTIANDAVTYAKMQNISATSRILGRKTSGAGDTEECTLSEVLDFIGSAAQGDILYRGASAWARLAAGTNGHFLKTQGAGANPQWAAQATSGPTLLASQTASGSSLDFSTIAASATQIDIMFASVSLSGSGHVLVRLGDAGGVEDTGYSSVSSRVSAEVEGTSGFVAYVGDAARNLHGIMTLIKVTGNTWSAIHAGRAAADVAVFGGGSKTVSDTVTSVRVLTSAGTFDNGTISVRYQ